MTANTFCDAVQEAILDISRFVTYLYPRYEVYRGYIVFAFSVIMFVCLSVCLSVNFFFRQRLLSNYLG